MAWRSYSYHAHMARGPDLVHGFDCAYGVDEDASCPSIRVRGRNDLRCPGMALRFAAVIDRTPSEERAPPVTIAFVKNGGGAPQAVVAAAFTLDSDEFGLISKRREIEAMVHDAGFPPECAPVVEDFCVRTTAKAHNSFYRGVAITVEIAPQGTYDDDEVEEEENDGDGDGDVEVEEDCPICLTKLVIVGTAAVQLPCSHAFHRECLDRWVSKRRNCPYCRSPVPQGLDILLYDGDLETEAEDDDYDAGEHAPAPLPVDHGAT